ncbi:MAG: hypothetical protein IT370_20235 [Deltaproteobacteria bacterium]|nr:hypothetical protein [Deltaproteobacteria bacterium]
MALRDDLTAALARIQALEQELAETRAELAALRQAPAPLAPAPSTPRAAPARQASGPLWDSPWVLGLARAPTRLAYVDKLGPPCLRVVSETAPSLDRVLAERGHETANRLGPHLVVQLDTLELARIEWPGGELARLALPTPLAAPALLDGDTVLCATMDGQLHRIDAARWSLLESRTHQGGQELKRLGFDRARGALVDELPGQASAVLAHLRRLDWSVDRALVIDGGAVAALSRRFGDDVHWGLARVGSNAAAPRWLHEVGPGMASKLALVDGWLVGFSAAHRDSVVLDLDTGRRWLRLHGFWEDARADVLDDDGGHVATLAL